MKADTIKRLAIHGPNPSDGTFLWAFGNMIYWRHLVMMWLITIPVVAGLVALELFGGMWAIFAALVAEQLVQDTRMRFNPKYTIEENY